MKMKVKFKGPTHRHFELDLDINNFLLKIASSKWFWFFKVIVLNSDDFFIYLDHKNIGTFYYI